MSRMRTVVGIVVGVLMVASACAHSWLGGKQMRASLAAANVPPDLLLGTLLGWHLGGALMLALGAIVLHTFARRRSSALVSLAPARIIAVTYLVFGAAALWASNFDPFFLAFIVPGLLLALASFPGVRPAGAR